MKLQKGRLVYHTKNSRSAELVPSPILLKIGRSLPKLPERCHPLTCPRIPNFIRIGCVLPDLFREDWFLGPKSHYNRDFQPTNMAKNDFQYGGWNSYTLQCGTIMTLISPGDCTLQCGMWLWNRDSEFTKWQHPAMWHVALESWHWIRQVAAPCSVAGGSGMTCHSIRPNVRRIGILHLVSISTTLPQSTCHSAIVSKILSKSNHPRQKKMTSCPFSRWRISAILDFRGPIMGSLKSPCATSYRSWIETKA